VTVPNWYQLVLLSLASFRVWRLLAHDDVLNAPRRLILRLGDWQHGRPVPDGYRGRLADFLTCPACCGFWVCVAWWAAFQWSAHWATVVAVPWASSALLLLADRLVPAE
jgi:hypothetical protein